MIERWFECARASGDSKLGNVLLESLGTRAGRVKGRNKCDEEGWREVGGRGEVFLVTFHYKVDEVGDTRRVSRPTPCNPGRWIVPVTSLHPRFHDICFKG